MHLLVWETVCTIFISNHESDFKNQFRRHFYILEKISDMEPQSNLKVENNDLVISKDELPQSGFAKLLSVLRLKLFS